MTTGACEITGVAGCGVGGERAILSVRCSDVVGTCCIATSASFFGVAGAGRGSTYLRGGRELAFVAAVFVGVVADSVAAEFACCCITAGIVAAAAGTATVAVFAVFNDAVAALIPGNGNDAFVRGEAGCVNSVTADGGADVTDGACRKVGNAGCGEGVHDVLFACIAGAGAKRATLLGGDEVVVGTGLRVAVVDGTESVPGLVGDDLPF